MSEAMYISPSLKDRRKLVIDKPYALEQLSKVRIGLLGPEIETSNNSLVKMA
jgi:hypothetical protein